MRGGGGGGGQAVAPRPGSPPPASTACLGKPGLNQILIAEIDSYDVIEKFRRNKAISKLRSRFEALCAEKHSVVIEGCYPVLNCSPF